MCVCVCVCVCMFSRMSPLPLQLVCCWLGATEMTSPEAAAISVNSQLLCEVMYKIAGVTWFANKLVESSFITSTASDAIVLTLGLSDPDKCYRLLSTVKIQVEVNPAQFHTLVGILRSEPALMSYADVMIKSYGRWRTHCLRVWA